MEFRLTYEGALHSYQGEERKPQRNRHVHWIRREFHKQLKLLWHSHPILNELRNASPDYCNKPNGPKLREVFQRDGFNWLPVVTSGNGLICQLDILMLRHGPPGRVPTDIDNRMKTLFDALRKASDASQLSIKPGEQQPAEQEPREQPAGGQLMPTNDESPFYVLLEDDKLITHVSVTSDTLLEPVTKPGASLESAVRLVVGVTVRPYHPYSETVGFA